MNHFILFLTPLFFSPNLFANNAWDCINDKGDTIRVTETDTPYTPFITVESEKVTTKGFSYVRKAADGKVQYNYRSSINDSLSITTEDNQVVIYWSLGSSVRYVCE